MPNQYVLHRLAGIHDILKGVHRSGGSMSSATKGQERATFVEKFLSKVMPTPYRVGTGDATDAAGNRSGQLDIVVEYPFAPCLPDISGESRLYLAEGIAAVIEVKSNVQAQWDEAVQTADQLALLTRTFGANMSYFGQAPDKIPLFVVGYTGWQQPTTVREHLERAPSIAGILVIDPGIFVSQPRYDEITCTGDWALWALITTVYRAISALQMARTNAMVYAE